MPLVTSLEPDELIVGVRVPAAASAHGSVPGSSWRRAPRRLRARGSRRRPDASPADGADRAGPARARRRRDQYPVDAARRRPRMLDRGAAERGALGVGRRGGGAACEPPSGRARLGGLPAAARARARRSGRCGRRPREAARRRIARVDGERRRPRARGRGAADARRLPPRRPGPDRHAPRLRARRLRCLHGPAGRGHRALCIALRRAGRRRRAHDRRGPGAPGGAAPPTPGGVPRAPRPAVRLLHAGVPDDRATSSSASGEA